MKSQIITMRDYAEERERQHRLEEGVLKRKQRAEVIASGGSCLTCKHTKIAYGKKLNCKLKDKLVSQYNYCEKYIQIESKGESK